VDYLVFGVGFGSTLVLLGWVLRQFGPSFRYRSTPDDILSAEELLERNDWQRFCIAMGALLSVCGAVMLLVTLITLLIRPSDRVGTIVVGVIFALSLIAVAGWIVMYVSQHRALAGDRRAEAVAATRGRRPAKTRPAAAAPAKAEAAPTAVVTSAEPVNAAEGLEDLAKRRAAAQGQQRAAGSRPGAPASGAPSRAATPTQRAQPLQESTEQQETPPPAQTGETPSDRSPGVQVSPAAALRNVQFKRAGSNRAQGAGRQERTTPSPISPAAEAGDPASKDSAAPEPNGADESDGVSDASAES